MATIQSNIKLNDGMTPALRSINKALNLVLNTFEAVQRASMRPIDTAACQAARNELARAAVHLNQIETESTQAATATKQLTNNMTRSAQVAQQMAAPVDRVEREINQANTAEMRLLNSMNKTLRAIYQQSTNQIRVTASLKRALPAINQNTQAQERFNNSLKRGSSSASGLTSKITALVGAYAGIQGAKGIIGTADSLTQTTARLNLMNKGQETTAELEEKIYQSALRSRSAYLDTASAVSKLGLQTGNLFKTNDQIIQFTENFNKMAVVSGASGQQSSAALLQITQALASGVLRGDELKSVLENMPVVAQYIAKEMNVPVEQIRELGYEGKISAKTLAAAMLNATDDINKKFKSMPYTWGQVWTLIQTYSLKVFRPILTGISKITSSQKFIRFANEMGNILARISGFFQNLWTVVKPILNWIYDSIAGIYNFIKNNWSWIAPIVLGIAAAFLVLKTPLMLAAIWMGICTVATKLWTAAQAVFNAVMAMNPVGLVCIAIILLIALFYAAIAAVNKWCGTSLSATGMIAGAFTWLWALLQNIFIGICNAFIGIYNIAIGCAQWVVEAWNWAGDNMGTIFDNIGIWWDNLWIDAQIGLNKFIAWALGKLSSLAQTIQPLAEMLDIDLSGIAGAAGKYSANSAALVASKQSYKKTTAFNPNVNWDTARYMKFKDMGAAYDKGYNWGAEKATQVENFFSGKKFKELSGDDYRALVEKYGAGNVDKYGNVKTGDENDIGKALSGKLPNTSGKTPDLSGIAKDVGNISDNTDTLAASDEELNFMRDFAERKAINRYTLTDLTLNMTNNNKIDSKFSMQEVVDFICNGVSDQIANEALGNHI